MLKLTIALTCVLLGSIAPTAATAQTIRMGRVISLSANLRDTPSVAGLSEQEVPEGTVVRVLDQKLPWYVVRVGDRVGWMHGNTFEFLTGQGNTYQEPRQMDVVPDSTPRVFEPRQERTPTRSSSGGYIRGPRGGCYYISGSGRKVYVDRGLCN